MASADVSRRDLSKTTVVVVCAPLVYEKAGPEIHPRWPLLSCLLCTTAVLQVASGEIGHSQMQITSVNGYLVQAISHIYYDYRRCILLVNHV